MKPEPESRRLLDDLLADDPALRERFLAGTLREVRARRRRRQTLRVSVVAILLGGLAVWGPTRRSASDRPSLQAMTPRLETVVSVPLPAGQLVMTRPHSIPMVATAGGPTVVRTPPDPVPLVDDDGLFQLLAGRPAMIIRPAEGPARLIFPDETEAAARPSN